jgi:hypothetical protein
MAQQPVWTPDQQRQIRALGATAHPFPSRFNGPLPPGALPELYGLPSQDEWHAEQIQKARRVSQDLLAPHGRGAAPEGELISPTVEQGRATYNGTRAPANLLTYPMLRELGRIDTIRAVINTRTAQVAQWCHPSHKDPDGNYKYRPGFTVEIKDKRKSPTRAQLDMIEQIKTFLYLAGGPGFRPQGAPQTLEGMARMVLRDSLTLDAGAIEKVRTRGGQLAYLLPLDAATIRYSLPTAADLAHGWRDPRDGYVQVDPYTTQVRATFDARDLIYLVRNPSTELWRGGYGEPELEILIAAITTLLNSETYNASNFTNGLQAAGVLAVVSNMGPEQFEVWQRKLYMMLNGPSAINRLAAVQLNPQTKDDIKHIPLGNTNKEMQYQEWIQYLIKKVCMLYQMDPAEIGLVHGNEGQDSSLNSADPDSRIKASHERGLFPLVRLLFGTLQAHVVEELDPDFEVVPQGLEPDTREKTGSRLKSAGESYLTINEVRAAQGLEPLEDENGEPSPFGAWINNPTFFNAAQQAAAQAAAAEQGPPQDDEQDPPQGDEAPQGDDDEGEATDDEGDQGDGQAPPRGGQGQPRPPAEEDDFDIDALFAASPLGSLKRR